MRNYLIIFLLFLLCSCQMTVEVDVPRDKESLVINSMLVADSLWAVGVSYDRGILDNAPFKPVENATVVIYDESGPIETLKINNQKLYRSAINRPVPGKRYEVHVSAPGHDPVSAFAYLPRATEIVSVKTRDTFFEDNPATAFDITIKDDPDVENYYRVFVTFEMYFSNGSGFTPVYNRASITSDDPLLDSDNNLSESGVLIKDAVFNGKETKLSMKMGGKVNGAFQGGKIRVNVQTLSKEAYDYFTTLTLQQNTADDPFAQPVNVFNNIEGGFGIFAGYNQTTAYVDDPSYPVVTSITPMSGSIYDEVVIEGSNFRTNAWDQVQVVFSGERFPSASIMELTATHVRVQVPYGAVTGPITIVIRGQLFVSKEDFVVNY